MKVSRKDDASEWLDDQQRFDDVEEHINAYSKIFQIGLKYRL